MGKAKLETAGVGNETHAWGKSKVKSHLRRRAEA